MQRHNLLEYSDNYFMKSGSLWNYHVEGINYADNTLSDGK